MLRQQDIDTLRRLAWRRREIGELPEMEAKRLAFRRHNALTPGQPPLLLCFPEGAWQEIFPENALTCENPLARAFELQLRRDIYWHDVLRDDAPFEPQFEVGWRVDFGSYGVEAQSLSGESRESRRLLSPIEDLKRDFHLLKDRQYQVDRRATLDVAGRAMEWFGDLLPVAIRGGLIWSYGLTQEAIRLIGLENFMLDMIDCPEQMHGLMAYLLRQHMRLLDFFEEEGLLTLNNRADYVGSGGIGYIDELPGRPLGKNPHVTAKELWCLVEAQETVGISDDMFAEFVLPYQKKLMERFGLVCYGCCEPLHTRWKYLKDIPNLRRVSVSPWCDQTVMGQVLPGRAVFSRKPLPTLLCSESFEEEAVRKDIRFTLEAARDCNLEIISKDTHTLCGQTWRLARWVELAREEIAAFYG